MNAKESPQKPSIEGLSEEEWVFRYRAMKYGTENEKQLAAIINRLLGHVALLEQVGNDACDVIFESVHAMRSDEDGCLRGHTRFWRLKDAGYALQNALKAVRSLKNGDQPPPPAPLPSLREVEEHLRDMAGKQWNLPHHARLDNAAADVLALVRESDQQRSSDDRPNYVYVSRSKLSRLVRLEEAT